MTPLAILKKVRRGLTPRKNFDGSEAGCRRPHCVLGEWNRLAKSERRYYAMVFTTDERDEILGIHISHSRALAILDAAIRRQQKKEKRR